MEQQPNGVWLRDGNLIYMLEGTGEFRKGLEIQRNKFEVVVPLSFGSPRKPAEELTEKILGFLRADSAEPSGAELFIAAKAAQQKFKTWLTTTFPIGTTVEFPFSGSRRTGEVTGVGFDRADDPMVIIRYKTFTCRVNPLTESIKVLAAATPQA